MQGVTEVYWNGERDLRSPCFTEGYLQSDACGGANCQYRYEISKHR